MPIQSAAEFRAAAARHRRTVDVEIEGVGTVRLRALSAGAALQFHAEVRKCQAEGGSVEGLAFPLIAQSWVGDDGDLWLPEVEGIELAKSLDTAAFNKLAMAVMEMNGLSPDAVDESEKNFAEPGESGPTPTGSRSNSDTPT